MFVYRHADTPVSHARKWELCSPHPCVGNYYCNIHICELYLLFCVIHTGVYIYLLMFLRFFLYVSIK